VSGGMTVATVDPTTGETVRTFQTFDDSEIETRIARAADAFTDYWKCGFAEWMNTAADTLDRQVDDIAALITFEMGKRRNGPGSQ
jgi:succinate-semialdehyde dehydrogenase/glutarate-semialdehyde dehydrogenase